MPHAITIEGLHRHAICPGALGVVGRLWWAGQTVRRGYQSLICQPSSPSAAPIDRDDAPAACSSRTIASTESVSTATRAARSASVSALGRDLPRTAAPFARCMHSAEPQDRPFPLCSEPHHVHSLTRARGPLLGEDWPARAATTAGAVDVCPRDREAVTGSRDATRRAHACDSHGGAPEDPEQRPPVLCGDSLRVALVDAWLI